MSKLSEDIYTKEELKSVIDTLIGAGYNFNHMFIYLNNYTYALHSDRITHDIYFYGKFVMRYRYYRFITYL